MAEELKAAVADAMRERDRARSRSAVKTVLYMGFFAVGLAAVVFGVPAMQEASHASAVAAARQRTLPKCQKCGLAYDNPSEFAANGCKGCDPRR